MAIRLPYETKTGHFDEAATQMQIIEYLRLLAEACYACGHYKKANGDELIGQGYLAMGQMYEKNVTAMINLATKGVRQ
jgi:hypothetical protein